MKKLLLVLFMLLFVSGCSQVRDVYYSSTFQDILDDGLEMGAEELGDEYLEPYGRVFLDLVSDEMGVEITPAVEAAFEQFVEGAKVKAVEEAKNGLNQIIDALTNKEDGVELVE